MGFYARVDGAFSLLAAIGGRRHLEDRCLLAPESIVGTRAGVVTLRAPALTAVMLAYFISIGDMATGFLRTAAAIRRRKEISGEAWPSLSGVLSAPFALMPMLRPAVGAPGLVWVIAGYALILGVFGIMLGVGLRGVRSA